MFMYLFDVSDVMSNQRFLCEFNVASVIGHGSPWNLVHIGVSITVLNMSAM